MKNVLVMQDLSCLGKCSLTVILPVLSAMGVTCTPLPTAVLSAHTGFPGPHFVDLSREIGPIADHWASVGAEFSGILTGYLAGPGQAAQAETIIRKFRRKDTFVLCDPAMADHGRMYAGLGPETVRAMEGLCRQADLALPNVTEAAMLAGLPFREPADEGYCAALASALQGKGIRNILITGLEEKPGKTGFFWKIGTESGGFSLDRLPRSCHGTGDLFAAAVMGGVMQGRTPEAAGMLAAEFVKRSIAATPADSRWGVAFEQALPLLMERSL